MAAGDLPRQVAQPVRIRRRGDLLDQLPELRDHEYIQPAATQIKTSMKHQPSRRDERLTAPDQRVTVNRGRRPLLEWPARAAVIRAAPTYAVRRGAPTPLRRESPQRGRSTFIAFQSESGGRRPLLWRTASQTRGPTRSAGRGWHLPAWRPVARLRPGSETSAELFRLAVRVVLDYLECQRHGARGSKRRPVQGETLE
jgi:hypothetical protein